MALPFLEVQGALYRRLKTDSALSGLVNEIYDYVPVDAPFPYIVIGEPRLEFEDVKNSDVQEMTVTLHAWYSQKSAGKYGNAATYRILDAVYTALKYKLKLESWDIVRTVVVEPKVFSDIDDAVKHGVLTYRFTVKRK